MATGFRMGAKGARKSPNLPFLSLWSIKEMIGFLMPKKMEIF